MSSQLSQKKAYQDFIKWKLSTSGSKFDRSLKAVDEEKAKARVAKQWAKEVQAKKQGKKRFTDENTQYADNRGERS